MGEGEERVQGEKEGSFTLPLSHPSWSGCGAAKPSGLAGLGQRRRDKWQRRRDMTELLQEEEERDRAEEQMPCGATRESARDHRDAGDLGGSRSLTSATPVIKVSPNVKMFRALVFIGEQL